MQNKGQLVLSVVWTRGRAVAALPIFVWSFSCAFLMLSYTTTTPPRYPWLFSVHVLTKLWPTPPPTPVLFKLWPPPHTHTHTIPPSLGSSVFMCHQLMTPPPPPPAFQCLRVSLCPTIPTPTPAPAPDPWFFRVHVSVYDPTTPPRQVAG